MGGFRFPFHWANNRPSSVVINIMRHAKAIHCKCRRCPKPCVTPDSRRPDEQKVTLDTRTISNAYIGLSTTITHVFRLDETHWTLSIYFPWKCEYPKRTSHSECENENSRRKEKKNIHTLHPFVCEFTYHFDSRFTTSNRLIHSMSEFFLGWSGICEIFFCLFI